MAYWPATLQQFPLEGTFMESNVSGVIRTPMETGPAKTRRRYTGTSTQYSFDIHVTLAQRDILDLFFNLDCLEGSIPFLWTHPVNFALYSARFLAPPTYRSDSNEFLASVIIETLPVTV